MNFIKYYFKYYRHALNKWWLQTTIGMNIKTRYKEMTDKRPLIGDQIFTEIDKY